MLLLYAAPVYWTTNPEEEAEEEQGGRRVRMIEKQRNAKIYCSSQESSKVSTAQCCILTSAFIETILQCLSKCDALLA